MTRDFARPRYFNPFEAVGYGLIDAVLEPKDGRAVGKDWEALGSEVGSLPLLADDEQPLPTNVMYPGTSEFWRNDDFGGDDEDEAGAAAAGAGAAGSGSGSGDA